MKLVPRRKRTFTYRISSEQVEKICRQGQRNNLLFFLNTSCFTRTAETYSGNSSFFLWLGIQLYHKPSYLICSSHKKALSGSFSPSKDHLCAVTSEHLETHSQKRSWTILGNALLPINIPVNLLFCIKRLILTRSWFRLLSHGCILSSISHF